MAERICLRLVYCHSKRVDPVKRFVTFISPFYSSLSSGFSSWSTSIIRQPRRIAILSSSRRLLRSTQCQYQLRQCRSLLTVTNSVLKRFIEGQQSHNNNVLTAITVRGTRTSLYLVYGLNVISGTERRRPNVPNDEVPFRHPLFPHGQGNERYRFRHCLMARLLSIGTTKYRQNAYQCRHFDRHHVQARIPYNAVS